MKAGAEQGLTPSDVVLAADITFSCVADPQAAKDVSIKSETPNRKSKGKFIFEAIEDD